MLQSIPEPLAPECSIDELLFFQADFSARHNVIWNAIIKRRISMKLKELVKETLGELITVFVRVTGDLLATGFLIYVVSKAAFFTSDLIEKEVAATHDSVLIAFLKLIHGLDLIGHGLVFTWVLFVCVRRILRNFN